MALLPQVLVLSLVVAGVHGVSFYMGEGKKKCLQEDVHKDVLVVGEYAVIEQKGVLVTTLEIADSRGHPVYRKDQASSGKFAFTSDDYDVYDICFSTKAAEGAVARDGGTEEPLVEITVMVKVGADARNYDELAKAEKLKPMELELRKLEDLAESIVNDFASMKQREEEHRDTNESTNDRLLHFSIFSMVCLIFLGVWQVLYLKRYFRQKKLI